MFKRCKRLVVVLIGEVLRLVTWLSGVGPIVKLSCIALCWRFSLFGESKLTRHTMTLKVWVWGLEGGVGWGSSWPKVAFVRKGPSLSIQTHLRLEFSGICQVGMLCGGVGGSEGRVVSVGLV